MRKQIAAVLTTLSLPALAATITVTPSETHQQIEGFGGGTVYYQGWILAHPAKDTILDTMFTGLGLSYLRLGNWNQDTTASLTTDSTIVAEGRRRIGSRFKILMSSWSAPGFLKGSGDKNGSKNKIAYATSLNTLKKSGGKFVYTDFAHWWKQSLIRYQKAGISPDVISIQNEPDMNAEYEETLFGATENDTIAGYPQALQAVHDSVSTLSTSPQIYGPEVLGIGYGEFQKYANSLDRSLLGGYNYHLYHGSTDSGYNAPDGYISVFKTLSAAYTGKPWMMSEYCPMRTHQERDMLALARLMINGFVYGNLSAYINWELAWGDGGQMVQVNNPWTTKTWSVNAEYHAMRHFSKFVNPGWTRVTSTANDTTKLRTVAFLSSGSDSLTVIAVNVSSSAQTLTLSTGSFSGTGEVWQSQVNGSKSVKLSSDGTGSISLPDSSITTIALVSRKSTGLEKHGSASATGSKMEVQRDGSRLDLRVTRPGAKDVNILGQK